MRITSAGFAPPANRKLGADHRTVAIAEFIASLSLAVSILVVVSVSVARADVVSGVIDNEGGVFAIALLLGLLFIGMGGVTIVSLPHPSRHRKTHSQTALSELSVMPHSRPRRAGRPACGLSWRRSYS